MQKKILSLGIFIIMGSADNAIIPDHLIEVTSIGIPAYKREQAAWRVNDLFIYDNRLYIGTGDAVINTGPTGIIYYNLEAEEYVEESIVDEEAIYAFENINGSLMIPGTDATEDWSFGNIYVHIDTGWVKHRTLPKALHVLDLTHYRDQLCAGAVSEASISESIKSYHGAVYASSDSGRNWEIMYLTPSDGNNVFLVDALTEFNGKLYAFVYAHCGIKESSIPEKYQASLGKPLEGYYQIINHDIFGINDILTYDGERWSYEDLIPGSDLARIVRPVAFKQHLVLPVIRGQYIDYLSSNIHLPAQARMEIYVYDGKKTKKLKLEPELLIDTHVAGDSLFILFKQHFYYVAVTEDLKKIYFYQLPSKIGTIRTFEYDDGIFYFGNTEGHIYRSTTINSVDRIQENPECVPVSCFGIMPEDVLIQSGWITMYERIDADSLAEIKGEVLKNNALRISTKNLRQFKIIPPEYYLDLSRHLILLVDHDIVFDGVFKSGMEIICRLDPVAKWRCEIVHSNN